MIVISNKVRSTQPEIMDDFSLSGKELTLLLSDLKTVNKLLGGTSITINSIKELIKNCDKTRPLKILDVGCGDGEMLRNCYDFGKKEKLQLKLVGVDANKNIINEARNRSQNYPSISFIEMDVIKDVSSLDCDIALCTLFLHHFDDQTIINFLKKLSNKVAVGIIVNDLHRSKLAFNLFKLFSLFFIKTPIAKKDGLISIARGFKKEEIKTYLNNIDCFTSVTWKWAFRYCWIIKK